MSATSEHVFEEQALCIDFSLIIILGRQCRTVHLGSAAVIVEMLSEGSPMVRKT